MDQADYRALVTDAAKRATERLDPGVIGHLVLAQMHGEKEFKIREP